MLSKTKTLSTALEYAALGMRVFPVCAVRLGKCSCERASCNAPGKHPVWRLAPHGHKNASTDATQIQSWWFAEPDANLGIATGAQSGVVVIDVDPRNGGAETLASIERDFAPFPATIKAKTGGGGWHFYFRHPGNRISNGNQRLGPGLDVKGDGGYVVAPPSAHISGAYYVWMNSPSAIALAAVPTWLLDLILSGRAAKFSLNRNSPTLRLVPGSQTPCVLTGFRNDRLFNVGRKFAYRAVADCDSELALMNLTLDYLKNVNTLFGLPLETREITTVASSVAFSVWSARTSIHTSPNRGKLRLGRIPWTSRAEHKTEIRRRQRLGAKHSAKCRSEAVDQRINNAIAALEMRGSTIAVAAIVAESGVSRSAIYRRVRLAGSLSLLILKVRLDPRLGFQIDAN